MAPHKLRFRYALILGWLASLGSFWLGWQLGQAGPADPAVALEPLASTDAPTVPDGAEGATRRRTVPSAVSLQPPRRALTERADRTSQASSARGAPRAATGELREDSAELTELTAHYHLANGRLDLAARALSRGPVDDHEVILDVAAALRAAGRDGEALDLLAASLNDHLWVEDLVTEMIELDPARCLTQLERVLSGYPVAEGETLAHEHEGYARCLHALGRDAEVASTLEPLEERVHPPSGCMSWNMEGEAWTWAVYRATDPEGVVRELTPLLDCEHAPGETRGRAAAELIEVALSRGELGEARAVLAQYARGETDELSHIRLVELLDAEAGLKLLEDFHASRPGDAELTTALAERLERVGRVAAATEALTAWLHENLDENPWEDWDLFRRHRDVFLPELDRHCAVLLNESLFPGREPELDERLGNLADIYDEYGDAETARRLYERARDLDPEDSEWWEALQRSTVRAGR